MKNTRFSRQQQAILNKIPTQIKKEHNSLWKNAEAKLIITEG